MDKKEALVIRDMWSRSLGVENSDLAMRYLDIIRDTFYARINFQNYTFEYLQNFFSELRAVINEFTERRSELETDESF